MIFDGEVAAGSDLAIAALQSGHCLRILTGAPVPDSVEAVVMKENCRVLEGHIEISCQTKIGENMRMQGEEVEVGSDVLAQGMLVSPPIIGLIATLGHTSVEVFRQPKFAVIATGDELVEPGTDLQGCQIYNSNSYALAAALQAQGIKAIKSLHARDDREETRAVLAAALAESDVIISIGGVSVGERDFVKDVFEELVCADSLLACSRQARQARLFWCCRKENRRRRCGSRKGNFLAYLEIQSLPWLPLISCQTGIENYAGIERKSAPHYDGAISTRFQEKGRTS